MWCSTRVVNSCIDESTTRLPLKTFMVLAVGVGNRHCCSGGGCGSPQTLVLCLQHGDLRFQLGNTLAQGVQSIRHGIDQVWYNGEYSDKNESTNKP